MREEYRFPFYMLYHLLMCLVLAFGIAFFMLHPYSTSHGELSSTEQLARTFNYVFPKWYFTIYSAAGILGLFSFGSYGLLRAMSHKEYGIFMAGYGISLFLSLAIFIVIYGSMIALFAFILVPAIVQCFVLMLIEWAWVIPSEKTKRIAA